MTIGTLISVNNSESPFASTGMFQFQQLRIRSSPRGCDQTEVYSRHPPVTVIIQITMAEHRSQPSDRNLIRRIQHVSFDQYSSISSQIKRQLSPLLRKNKSHKKKVRFEAESPCKRRPICIKELYGRLNLPSTKSSLNTSLEHYNPEIPHISEFSLVDHRQKQSRLDVVCWVISLASEFKLSREILYTTVHHIDKYHSLCHLREYQRDAALAVFSLVKKLQEQNPISVSEYLSKLNYQLTHSEFVQLEMDVFSKLEYKLVSPTLFSRLLYHLTQLPKMNKLATVWKVKIPNLLLEGFFKEYLTICKRLDAVLLSNLHESHCLDSIIYFLVFEAYQNMYNQKQLYFFEKVYEEYWKNRYIALEVKRMQRLSPHFNKIQFNQVTEEKPSGLTHQDSLRIQTHDSSIKAVAIQISNLTKTTF